MKLVNNMLVQVNTVAVAEALVLGVKAGLDPRAIYDVVRVSTGNSWAFESSVPRILRRDFSPGGTVDIAFKDQELETAFAKQLGVPVLLANVTQQVYQMARAAGLNKEDGSAVIKVLEQLAGVRSAGRPSAMATYVLFTAPTRAAGSGSRWRSGSARPGTSSTPRRSTAAPSGTTRSGPGSRSAPTPTKSRALLFYEDLRDVVLVGTSSGGMVICRAAELAATASRGSCSWTRSPCCPASRSPTS